MLHTPVVSLVLFATHIRHSCASNPAIKHRYSADPSAHVWPTDPDRVYVYCSHDHDDQDDMGQMSQYFVYSSTDLVNWDDHGLVFHVDNATWARKNMWAPDAVYWNGLYYFVYCALEHGSNMFRTGLATSEKPYGPFTDLGYIKGVEWGQDPALFVDDDGTPYLYWGLGGFCKMAKLSDDLLEALEVVELTHQLPNVYEGPWVHKYNGLYYIMYAAKNKTDEEVWGEWLEYATAPKPWGPFTVRGKLLDTLDHYPHVGKSWTSHGSIMEFKGQWYLFYHTTGLSQGHDKRRSTAIEYLHHNPDGTISEIVPTLRGVQPVVSHHHTHSAKDGSPGEAIGLNVHGVEGLHQSHKH